MEPDVVLRVFIDLHPGPIRCVTPADFGQGLNLIITRMGARQSGRHTFKGRPDRNQRDHLINAAPDSMPTTPGSNLNDTLVLQPNQCFPQRHPEDPICSAISRPSSRNETARPQISIVRIAVRNSRQILSLNVTPSIGPSAITSPISHRHCPIPVVMLRAVYQIQSCLAI